jgi:hypothetical protein
MYSIQVFNGNTGKMARNGEKGSKNFVKYVTRFRLLLNIFGKYASLGVGLHAFLMAWNTKMAVMQLYVYADIQQLTPVGEIEIRYNRITNIDVKIPVKPNTRHTITTTHPHKKQPARIRPCKIYCEQTAYTFTVQKLSKGDLPYRQRRLTHQILSDNLTKVCAARLYVKLTLQQRLHLDYYAKHFFWQTTDCRSKIYQSIINYTVPAVIGALLTLVIMAASQGHTIKPAESTPAGKEKNSTMHSTQDPNNKNSFHP